MEKARLDKIIAGDGDILPAGSEAPGPPGPGAGGRCACPVSGGQGGCRRQWRLWWTGPCCTAAATPGSCFISLRGSSPPRRTAGGPQCWTLLPPELRRRGLFPVGRLDKDTEGLLLLTNEGGLAHDILSPKHHVDKVYYARAAGLSDGGGLQGLCGRHDPGRTAWNACRRGWRSSPPGRRAARGW